ncbi:MAG: hypothetical protein N3D10_00495 [Candidatus Micrarchaeota archaeon]|nr:hypothetical protein [Candidatus Micrarchaeota archaeon]
MKKEKSPSTKEQVEQYLYDNPLLLYYSYEGILNISAVAKKIKNELGIKKSDEAVMINLYRVIEKQEKKVKKEEIKSLIKGSTINIYSDYAVLVADIKQNIKAKNLISFSDKQVAIGERKELEKYKNKTLYYQDNLGLVEFKHPQNIEKIPGVLFYMLANFYQHSISIVEIFSVWDSTYILVEKRDIAKVMKMFF